RMQALAHLRELQRVAEQDDRPRARPDRERVRERNLARLVDEDVVELLVELRTREQPGRPGDQLQPGVVEVVVVAGALDERANVDGLRVAAARLLQPMEFDTGGRGDVLYLTEQVVDRLVRRRGDADALAAHDQMDDQPRARIRL